MSASIGDPFLLANYSLPPPSKKAKGKAVAVDERPHVLASHFAVPKRDDGHLVVATQGDGLYVLDLSDLHPVSSQTLGPSTSFQSCPAALAYSEGEKNFRRTFVAIQCSPEVSKDDEGRVVWSWKEDMSGDIGSSPEKTSYTLAHNVSYIFTAPELRSNVLFVSADGQVIETDMDFNTQNTWTPQVESTVLEIFVFPRRSCQFVSPGCVPSNGVLFLMFASESESLWLQVIAFGQEGEMVVLDRTKVTIGHSSVLGVSCDSSGHISVLRTGGIWIPYRVDIVDRQVSISATSKPLHLKGLRFIKDDGTKDRQRLVQNVSLLSLGSSYVLLAAVTASTEPEIAFLLWDVQFGVLLHSQMLPTPSTLDKNASCSLKLIRGSPSHALLVLSPLVTKTISSQLRSSILVVPFTIPPSSTIANALGRAAAGSAWLTEDGNSVKSSASDTEAMRKVLLEKIRDAIEEEKPSEADRLFLDWAREYREPFRGKAFKSRTEMPSGVDDARDAEMDGGEDTKASEVKHKPDQWRDYKHTFLSEVLQIVLQPGTSSNKAYSPKIVQYMLKREVVSHGMVEGGVLPALLLHNDWDTIREMFTMIDIPEADLLHALHVVVQHHRARPEDTMVVDQPAQNSVPSVVSFFAHIVDYPPSPLEWRKAIHEEFSDVDDLMCLLQVLDEWVTIWNKREQTFELGETSENEQGVHIVTTTIIKKPVKTKQGMLPALENVLSFLQAVLDSSFLTLLQHPPSHAILRRILEQLGPQSSLNESLDILRGPLAPFAKAQAKALADSKKGRRKEDVDWRRRRKEIQEQNAINLGPYQVEELVF